MSGAAVRSAGGTLRSRHTGYRITPLKRVKLNYLLAFEHWERLPYCTVGKLGKGVRLRESDVGNVFL